MVRCERSWIAVGLALLAVVVLCGAAVPLVGQAQPAPPTTVLLVRHAEKAKTPGTDPPLSEVGRRRAETLADMLGGSGVTALYSSEYRRTRQTLEPLSARLGLEIQRIGAREVEALAAALRGHRGEVVLVAGHSNTLGPIITELGGGRIGPISEEDYDNLFVVTLYAEGRATVMRLRFEAPPPRLETVGGRPPLQETGPQ